MIKGQKLWAILIRKVWKKEEDGMKLNGSNKVNSKALDIPVLTAIISNFTK